MKTGPMLIVSALLLMAALILHQGRLLSTLVNRTDPTANGPMEVSAASLDRAEARLVEANHQLQRAQQELAQAARHITQLEQRLRQMEAGSPGSPAGFNPDRSLNPQLEPADEAHTAGVPKRSWGPEQAVGEPDTLQAGDLPTAWAPLTQDGGQEWLRLDYERTMDIAEVRVRETHNPGAVARVTAFLNDGTEVTLWEGTEPPAAAPVEMSFQVQSIVNAKSVKIYLDTKRTPGWNEIDAVELIGRDGSRQWASEAKASSTFAEHLGMNLFRSLER